MVTAPITVSKGKVIPYLLKYHRMTHVRFYNTTANRKTDFQRTNGHKMRVQNALFEASYFIFVLSDFVCN